MFYLKVAKPDGSPIWVYGSQRKTHWRISTLLTEEEARTQMETMGYTVIKVTKSLAEALKDNKHE